MTRSLAAFGVCAFLLPSAAWADASSPWGINTHLPSTADLDQARAAGVGWVRIDFNWFMAEPSRDGYQWALFDRIINDARARGLEVYATLAYTPDWANGGQGIGGPASNPEDWYDFVYDTVSRYKDRVHVWGMWNEPNLEQFFTGTRDQYIEQVLKNGARAAKAADPGCQIAGPELAHLSSAHWAAWMYEVLDEAGDSIDIVTHHRYADTGNEVIRSLGVWVPIWDRPLVTSIIETTGNGDKPLWLTETGWHTDEVSESQQALYYEQVLAGVEEHDWLDKVFFYELKDDPNIPEKWGILRSDSSPKEAFFTVQSSTTSH